MNFKISKNIMGCMLVNIFKKFNTIITMSSRVLTLKIIHLKNNNNDNNNNNK